MYGMVWQGEEEKNRTNTHEWCGNAKRNFQLDTTTNFRKKVLVLLIRDNQNLVCAMRIHGIPRYRVPNLNLNINYCQYIAIKIINLKQPEYQSYSRFAMYPIKDLCRSSKQMRSPRYKIHISYF